MASEVSGKQQPLAEMIRHLKHLAPLYVPHYMVRSYGDRVNGRCNDCLLFYGIPA